MSICDCFAVQLGDFRLPPRSFVVPTFRDNLSFPFTKVKQSKNNAFCLDCPTFQDGTHKLLRNVGNNRSTLRNVPEERISQHYSCFYSIVTFLDAVTTVVRFILFCGCLSAPVMAPLRTRRSVSEIILFPPCKVERIWRDGHSVGLLFFCPVLEYPFPGCWLLCRAHDKPERWTYSELVAVSTVSDLHFLSSDCVPHTITHHKQQYRQYLLPKRYICILIKKWLTCGVTP